MTAKIERSARFGYLPSTCSPGADSDTQHSKTAEYLASVVEHNCCVQIDVFVDLLIALDY
ncbi:hypothetical protein AS032_31130 [Rhodococcus qingshengii]|jgi:hypothetical protein|nr:hypothetical protein AOT96_32355 [Rhodococcus sp. 008]KSU68428.1 hypothetical protein AS032_31130 [Rhodococcus qingshengii]SCC68944.1 hypothetical protein GA0061093_12670 [Rhodococcus qingshengii]